MPPLGTLALDQDRIKIVFQGINDFFFCLSKLNDTEHHYIELPASAGTTSTKLNDSKQGAI